VSAGAIGNHLAAPMLAGGFALASIGTALTRGGATLAGRALTGPGASMLRQGMSLRRTPPQHLLPADRVHDLTMDDGVRLRVYAWGEATGIVPALLQHGFAANAHANWVHPGVVAALREAGRPVVAVDARGHGASDAPHDPSYYGEARMARDLACVAEALGLGVFDLVGYSMGAIATLLLASSSRRVRRLVVGGIGEAAVDLGGVDQRVFDPRVLAEDLLRDSPAAVHQPGSLLFRLFAERMGSDRAALAAQARAFHHQPIAFAAIGVPTRVIAGRRDVLARHPQRLAQALPDADLVLVPGDHLGAVAQPQFARAITDFFTH
jgi:pimeloyl-ACP methyl ester carboxylesterase